MADPGSLVDEPSSHTTPPGTPGYPPDTAGYPVEEGGASGAGEDGRGGTAAPWWVGFGFSSHSEFIEALKEDQERIGAKWRRRRAHPEVPAASLPGGEIADIPRPRRKPLRQVGIKLRPDDYDALARAARFYGARPTTLARLLVNRGVRAVLDAERDG